MTATVDIARLNEAVREESRLVQTVADEVKKVIVGQRTLIERMMVALLCRGHLLVEGVPGLAKTLAVKTLGQVLDHDNRDAPHDIAIAPGSRLAGLIGAPTLRVNSFHREAIAELGPRVRAVAHAPDGVIEAVELDGAGFALGIQWHQELFASADHRGNRIFAGFAAACG